MDIFRTIREEPALASLYRALLWPSSRCTPPHRTKGTSLPRSHTPLLLKITLGAQDHGIPCLNSTKPASRAYIDFFLSSTLQRTDCFSRVHIPRRRLLGVVEKHLFVGLLMKQGHED